MAVKMTIQSDIGQVFIDAYLHIDEITTDKNDNVRAKVRGYVSREIMKQGANFISGSEDIIGIKGDYSDAAINTKKQLYEHMKTLDKYKGAVDALEEGQTPLGK